MLRLRRAVLLVRAPELGPPGPAYVTKRRLLCLVGVFG